MDINQLKALFIEEATEVIEKLDIDIINFEENPENTELLDELYRGVHTLKGSANAFDFSKLGEFVHHFEDTLSYCREFYSDKNKIITSAEIDVFLEAVDIIKQLLQIEIAGSDELPQNYSTCLKHIKAISEQNLSDEHFMEKKDKIATNETVDNFDLSSTADNNYIETTIGVEFDNNNSDKSVIEIDMGITIDDVIKIKKHIGNNLESIQEIKIPGELTNLNSSSLLQLLFSIKKSKPSISIPLIDEPSISHTQYGKIICLKGVS